MCQNQQNNHKKRIELFNLFEKELKKTMQRDINAIQERRMFINWYFDKNPEKIQDTKQTIPRLAKILFVSVKTIERELKKK